MGSSGAWNRHDPRTSIHRARAGLSGTPFASCTHRQIEGERTDMQRRMGSAVAAVGSLTVVVLGMAAMDERVRAAVRQIADGRGLSPEALSIAHRMKDAVLVALDAMRDQSIDHAPLTIFALAATVLLLFMIRT